MTNFILGVVVMWLALGAAAIPCFIHWRYISKLGHPQSNLLTDVVTLFLLPAIMPVCWVREEYRDEFGR